jgi:ANTH domain
MRLVQDFKSLMVGRSLCSADAFLGYGPLIREYVFFLLAKLAFHRQHPEFNGKPATERRVRAEF